METYVCSWSIAWGWCWQKMRASLQAKGHTVFTPTLTGLGDRVHLANS
jgi:hypothetical protein